MIVAVNWRHYLIFITFSNLLNICGWLHQNSSEIISHIYYPENVKDALGMMFWNSLFQTLLFLRFGRMNFPYLYFGLILLIPRLVLYLCGPNYNVLMEILNSHNGIQPIWIEPLYNSGTSILSIDRYSMYFIAISVQVAIIYTLTRLIDIRVLQKPIKGLFSKLSL